MNKLRRDPAAMRPQFPSVDKKTAHTKGNLAGNMMGYPAEKLGPQTAHVQGSMPGNMMGYKASKEPMKFPKPPDESMNYGPDRLKEPTKSGFSGKTKPAQMTTDYKPIDANNKDWTQIQSVYKKKGAFYG